MDDQRHPLPKKEIQRKQKLKLNWGQDLLLIGLLEEFFDLLYAFVQSFR